MTYDEFYKKYIGKAVDFDGTAGIQCVDLVDQYLKDVFNITGVWVNGARDFYNKFTSYPALVKAFDKVENTRELIVKKGDIVIWGGGSWGHCAIGTGDGTMDWFKSIEQNTRGRHEPTQEVKHTFNKKTGDDCCWPVLGVLRAKDQSKVLGKSEKKVKVTAKSGLNVRTGAGVDIKNKVVGLLKYGDVVAITSEKTVSGQKWGYLKSKQGWICLEYTTKA